MAGDWIKFRKSLIKDGRVKIVSRNLVTHVTHVTGALVTLWSLADDYADENGLMYGYKKKDIDAEVGLDGFCDALPQDWIDLSGEWVRLPEYQQHNGETAKKRADAAERQRRHRENNKHVTNFCDKSVTREEKRRVIKKKANKKENDYPPDFESAWRIYPKRAGSNPKRDAFSAWRTRVKEGVQIDNILSGVIRYANFCEHTGKTGTETVMQAKRFFGKSEPFLESWELPTNETRNRVSESPSTRASRIFRERTANSAQAVSGHEDSVRGAVHCEPGHSGGSGGVGTVLDGEFSREKT